MIEGTYASEGQLSNMYQNGFGEREAYLKRGRDCSKLTIPTL